MIVLGVFACNKSANINANKSYLSFNHVAYGVGSANVYIDSNAVFPSALSFGQTSGDSLGNPYATVTSNVNYLVVRQGSNIILQGYSPFQLGIHYSMFLFDSLQQKTPSLMIFQDNPPVLTDSIIYCRFMNFSPGYLAIGLKLINTRTDIPFAGDTLFIGPANFTGYNTDPTSAAYNFNKILYGKYNVFAFADSTYPSLGDSIIQSLGSLELDSTVNYNLFLQGILGQDTGINRFQLRSVRLN